MAELLNTKINGTLNINLENNEIFKVDSTGSTLNGTLNVNNGNLILNSGNNEIFKVENDSSVLALKKNGFNLFSVGSNGLDLYIPSINENEFNNAKILNINNKGLNLIKGDLVIDNGIIGKSSLNIDGNTKINLSKSDDTFSINYKDSLLIRQTTNILNINNKDYTNIHTGFLNININKNTKPIQVYGSKNNEIGVPATSDLQIGNYIFTDDGNKYKIKNIFQNPTIMLYIFLEKPNVESINQKIECEVPAEYYGEDIEYTSEFIENATKIEFAFV